MKKLAKITRAELGLGGYQGNEFGLSLDFENKKDGWGCEDFIGEWDPETIKWDTPLQME